MTAVLPATDDPAPADGRGGRRLLVALLVVLCCAVVIDLTAGRAFGADGLWSALTDPGSTSGRILYLTRMPRVATALLAGAALGVAGVILQATLANPLASPELTGVNGCAVLGVVGAIWWGVVPIDGAAGPLLAALIGGLAGGLVTLMLSGTRRSATVLLVGVLLSAAAGAATVLLLALRSDAFGSVTRWLVGSVDGRTWSHLSWATPWILCWIVLVWAAARPLGMLVGGAEHAAALGVNVPRVRGSLTVAAVALVAGATALAGAMSFIGLAVPHLARRMVGGLHRTVVIPVAALGGAILLVGCDAVAQWITGALAGAEYSRRLGIPAGAVAAVLGAATLVVIARKDTNR